MFKDGPPDEHLKYRELSALRQAGILSPRERDELERHLAECESCYQIFEEYCLIAGEGMSSLGAHYSDFAVSEDWDDRAALHQLMAQVRQSEDEEVSGPQLVSGRIPSASRFLSWRVAGSRAAGIGLAACLIAAVGVGAYHLGSRSQTWSPKISAAIVMPQ